MRISMTSSLILLVALAAGCHGNLAIGRRHRACQYVAMSCGSTLQNMIVEMQVEGHIPDIGNMCGVANHAMNCLGECMGMVLGNPTMGRALRGVLNYVCDESRRERIEEIASADCFVDGSIERSFEGKSEACVDRELTRKVDGAMNAAFARGEYDIEAIMCPLVDNVMDCIDEEVEEMCGEEVVPFVNDIFNIVLSEMLSEQLPTCFEQVGATHNIMKRAVGYLKMMRK